MITKVSIQNFRSVETLEFHPSALCALVGENNAGKTNILRALKTVLSREWLNVRDFSPEDFTDHDASRDIVITVEFDPPLIHNGFAAEDPTPVPVLRFTLTHYKKTTSTAQKGDPRLVQECLDTSHETIMVLSEAPKKGQQHKYKPLTNVPRDVKEQAPLIYVGTERRLNDQLPYARYSLLRRLLEDVADALAEEVVNVDGDELTLPELFERRLNGALTVLRTDDFVQLENALSYHALENMGFDPKADHDAFALRFGLFEPMEFFKAMRLIVDEESFSVDALDMGHGAQNAIVVAIFQAYERLKKQGAVFLIEKPELHLHPHRARYFYQTLRRLSETNQIIYSTHSPHFVTVPYFDEVRVVYRGNDRRTYMNEPMVEIDDAVREKLIKELDPERNELFFARHVILVEGDTEKLAIPEYANRLGIDFNRLGISVVEVGGKRSLDLFIRILRALGLPTTVMFDADSSDFSGKQKDEEDEYNKSLLAYESELISVLMMNPKYEGEVRDDWGEERYLKACSDYPSMSKAIRARLWAMDDELPIPKLVETMLLGISGGDENDKAEGPPIVPDA